MVQIEEIKEDTALPIDTLITISKEENDELKRLICYLKISMIPFLIMKKTKSNQESMKLNKSLIII